MLKPPCHRRGRKAKTIQTNNEQSTTINMKFTKTHKIIAAVVVVAIIGIAVYKHRSKPPVTSKPLTPQGKPADGSEEMNATGKAYIPGKEKIDDIASFKMGLSLLGKNATVKEYNNFANGFNSSKSIGQMNAYINTRYPKNRPELINSLLAILNKTMPDPASVSATMPVFNYIKKSVGSIKTKATGNSGVGQ